MPKKIYLGDAVYIERGPFAGSFVLTTSDGVVNTNTIFLEPEVVSALVHAITFNLIEEG